MKECKNGQKIVKKSLKCFMATIRNHAKTYRKLYERLYFWKHQMDLIPGPIYGGIVSSPPSVNGNRLPKIIDKIDECKKGLAEIAEEKRIYHEFILSLTDKEAMVLHFYFWDELPVNRIAEMLDVSSTRIQEYMRKLESKWSFFAI